MMKEFSELVVLEVLERLYNFFRQLHKSARFEDQGLNLAPTIRGTASVLGTRGKPKEKTKPGDRVECGGVGTWLGVIDGGGVDYGCFCVGSCIYGGG